MLGLGETDEEVQQTMKGKSIFFYICTYFILIVDVCLAGKIQKETVLWQYQYMEQKVVSFHFQK